MSSFNLSSPSFSVIVDIVDIAEDKADVGLGFRVDFKKVRFSSNFVDSPWSRSSPFIDVILLDASIMNTIDLNDAHI